MPDDRRAESNPRRFTAEVSQVEMEGEGCLADAALPGCSTLFLLLFYVSPPLLRGSTRLALQKEECGAPSIRICWGWEGSVFLESQRAEIRLIF